MEKKTPVPPRHRAYPLRPVTPKPAAAARMPDGVAATATSNAPRAWSRAVPDGRRFPRG